MIRRRAEVRSGLEHYHDDVAMRMVLLGDVMLGRLVNRHLATAAPEYSWGDTLPLLRSADILVANLECVIADRGEPWPGKIFTFRSDLKNVAVLTAARATAVSLANNHSLDYGPEALRDCVAALDRHGIRPAGAGLTLEAARRPAEFKAGEMRAALVAFSDNEPEWEAGSTPGVHYVPMDPRDRRFVRLLAAVSEARRTHDLVIVSAHWGPNWGNLPPEEHVTAAHLFVDAGAHVIFGHSPHVVRGIEVYRGRPILYSCGNYVDDYAVDEVERNDESFIFCLDYTAGALQRLLLVPTMIEDFQARLAQGRDAERIVRRMRTLCAGLGTEARHVPEGLHVPVPAALTR
jgi:poly-gamma-glutamate capsule biosynthesis protein CapA/YwtB (metallophosphatase superfamily)